MNASSQFPTLSDDFHPLFQIICDLCGATLFHLFASKRPAIEAHCASCGKEHLIYDVLEYPAATPGKGEFSFEEMESTLDAPRKVYVSYEYGELDVDEQFDPNDITWCEVFVEKDGDLLQIFEDETA